MYFPYIYIYIGITNKTSTKSVDCCFARRKECRVKGCNILTVDRIAFEIAAGGSVYHVQADVFEGNLYDALPPERHCGWELDRTSTNSCLTGVFGYAVLCCVVFCYVCHVVFVYCKSYFAMLNPYRIPNLTAIFLKLGC